jgi:type I restriction enzyme S subunit
MTARQITTLADVCESVRYGYTASASLEPCGPRFLRITDIVPDSLDWESVPYCPIEEDDRQRFALQVNDIVVARTGATVGYAKLIREPEDSVFASYLVRFRVDPSKAYPPFVGRLVESQVYKAFVQSRIGGAAQPNASAPVLGSFEFALPDRDAQERIADTLSAYDDLIENNRRRMALLEESARLLYQEWFVRLRFPGHEHVRVVNGVPEGWDAGIIQDFYKTASGGTPSRTVPEYFTGDIPWVKTQELPNGFILDTDEKITEDAVKYSSAKIFPNRTLLVALYGATVGEVGILSMEAATNQACCAVMPKDDRAHFVHSYLFFRENKSQLMALSAGAAQNNISQQIIREYKMVMPPKSLMSVFTGALEPAFGQSLNLARQNEKLRAARDLLLPRLMSGEVAV